MVTSPRIYIFCELNLAIVTSSCGFVKYFESSSLRSFLSSFWVFSEAFNVPTYGKYIFPLESTLLRFNSGLIFEIGKISGKPQIVIAIWSPLPILYVASLFEEKEFIFFYPSSQDIRIFDLKIYLLLFQNTYLVINCTRIRKLQSLKSRET